MSALYDPDRVSLAASHAIERARGQGRNEIEPDDLLIGFLYAVSRFGIAQIGPLEVDLVALGLRFDLDEPVAGIKPRYSMRAASTFDRAARVARSDSASRLAPIHFLAVLGEPGVATFDRLAITLGIDHAAWRTALASCPPPPAQQPAAAGAGQLEQEPAQAPSADLLTPDETARLLGMHIQTVRGYIRGGKLPAFRVAGERAIRIRRDDVMSLLESTGSAAPTPQVPS